jgi:cytochrome oxidase assembly protein ShyY1
VYRFLLTPRWLGILVTILVAATACVLLGNWQWGRYELRHSVNAKIDASAASGAIPLEQLLPAAGTSPGTAGPRPSDDAAWRRVTATGTYDAANVVLVRGRTVNDDLGFEIVTPLVLADGSAVLVDRGWVPAVAGGAFAQPVVPPTPAGTVTVEGMLRLSESHGKGVDRAADGKLETRRIAVGQIASQLPYRVYGGFVALDKQTPPADAAFVPIPVDHQNDWLNFGYTIQWWIFAGMALLGYVWLARREARDRAEAGSAAPQGDDSPAPAESLPPG